MCLISRLYWKPLKDKVSWNMETPVLFGKSWKDFWKGFCLCLQWSLSIWAFCWTFHLEIRWWQKSALLQILLLFKSLPLPEGRKNGLKCFTGNCTGINPHGKGKEGREGVQPEFILSECVLPGHWVVLTMKSPLYCWTTICVYWFRSVLELKRSHTPLTISPSNLWWFCSCQSCSPLGTVTCKGSFSQQLFAPVLPSWRVRMGLHFISPGAGETESWRENKLWKSGAGSWQSSCSTPGLRECQAWSWTSTKCNLNSDSQLKCHRTFPVPVRPERKAWLSSEVLLQCKCCN